MAESPKDALPVTVPRRSEESVHDVHARIFRVYSATLMLGRVTSIPKAIGFAQEDCVSRFVFD